MPKEIVKKLIQIPSAGLGIIGGVQTVGKALDAGLINSSLDDLVLLLGAGAGSMLGSAGAGKAVDLAHSGGSKLLNKLRP